MRTGRDGGKPSSLPPLSEIFTSTGSVEISEEGRHSPPSASRRFQKGSALKVARPSSLSGTENDSTFLVLPSRFYPSPYFRKLSADSGGSYLV